MNKLRHLLDVLEGHFQRLSRTKRLRCCIGYSGAMSCKLYKIPRQKYGLCDKQPVMVRCLMVGLLSSLWKASHRD